MVSAVKLVDGYMVRFRTYLAEQNSKAFRFGEDDCMLFIAGVLLALTGVDVAKDIRGTYSDEASAIIALHALTGKTGFCEGVGAILGEHGLREGINEEVPSVCIVSVGRHEVGGVYYRGKVWCFQPSGYVIFEKNRIIKSWVV